MGLLIQIGELLDLWMEMGELKFTVFFKLESLLTNEITLTR